MPDDTNDDTFLFHSNIITGQYFLYLPHTFHGYRILYCYNPFHLLFTVVLGIHAFRIGCNIILIKINIKVRNIVISIFVHELANTTDSWISKLVS